MRPARRLLALLPGLLLCGCLESQDRIALRADGSGTLTSRFVVDRARTDELVEQAFAFAQMSDPSLASQPRPEVTGDPLHPAWFRAAAAATEGYEVTSAEQSEAEGRRTTTVEARFTTLAAAARGQAFYAASVTLERIEKSDECPKGGWRLVFDDLAPLTGMLPPDLTQADLRQMLGMLQPQLGGFVVERSLTLPTPILKTNGERGADGRSVRWRVDFDRLVGTEPLAMEVEFEAAEGLTLEPFRHAPRRQDLWQRVTRPPPGTEAKPEEAEPAEGEPGAPGPKPGETPGAGGPAGKPAGKPAEKPGEKPGAAPDGKPAEPPSEPPAGGPAR